MKSLIPYLILCLFLLVAGLYYRQFFARPTTSAGTSGAINNVSIETSAVEKNTTVAYFYMDSLENNYTVLKQIKEELKTKEQSLMNQILAKHKEYENDLNKYMQESTKLSPEQRSVRENNLSRQSNEVKNMQQTLQRDFQELSYKKMKPVYTNIEEYLKLINKERRFAYVVAYTPGLMFYQDPALNITGQLIKGLNEQSKQIGKTKH